MPGIPQPIPAAKADWRGSRGKGTAASSAWLQAHTLPITQVCAGPEELKQEAIPLHLLQPTARHSPLFLVERGSGEGSLQVSHPAPTWLKLLGAGCTTPHSRVGQVRLPGLWQSGTGGGPSASTPLATCRAPATRDFLRLPERSSASLLPSVFSLLTPHPPPTPSKHSKRISPLLVRLFLQQRYSSEQNNPGHFSSAVS